jgi:hypothetical protein
MINNLEKKELKKYEKDNLRNLKEYLKKNHNIDDIDKMKINDIISQIKCADRSESWKENKLYALKSHFKILGRKTKRLENVSNKQTEKIKTIEKNNSQSEKEIENYLRYEELEILLEHYEKYETIEEMNKYLILAAICTDQPVLRPGVLATSKIIYNKSDINDKDNFVVIDKKNYKNYFYINDDKVSESEKFKDIKEIKLYPIFSNIVRESLKKFPREYLFDLKVENKEIKLLNLLQDITELSFTFSMARSSFVNHWYKINPKYNQNDIKKLCEEMRHSDDAHRDYYRKCSEIDGNIFKHSIMLKFIEDEIEKDKSESDNDCDSSEDEENIEIKELSENYKKNAAYDLVYKANKRREIDEKYKIKDETIKKYNIMLDDDGKYYIKKKEKKIIKKEKKQLKEPLSQSEFNKRKADVIRFANKRIEMGKDAFIKAETMSYYNIKYNTILKKYE